jgi:hypothetical protein
VKNIKIYRELQADEESAMAQARKASSQREDKAGEDRILEAMDEIGPALYAYVADRTANLMRLHGESPSDSGLLAMRTEQVIYCIGVTSRTVKRRLEDEAVRKSTGAAGKAGTAQR